MCLRGAVLVTPCLTVLDRKRWDVCRDVPPVEAQKTPWKLVKVLRLLSIALVAVLVFGLAVGSKVGDYSHVLQHAS